MRPERQGVGGADHQASQPTGRTPAFPLKEMRSVWRIYRRKGRCLNTVENHSDHINPRWQGCKETRSEAAESGVVDKGSEKWLKSGYFFQRELKGFAPLEVGYEKKITLWFTDVRSQKEEAWWGESGIQKKVGDEEYGFGHVKFETPVGHPGGEAEIQG